MKLIIALLIIFWWVAVWGLFDIYTENKTKNEKLCIYVVIIVTILAILFFFPEFVNHLC